MSFSAVRRNATRFSRRAGPFNPDQEVWGTAMADPLRAHLYPARQIARVRAAAPKAARVVKWQTRQT